MGERTLHSNHSDPCQLRTVLLDLFGRDDEAQFMQPRLAQEQLLWLALLQIKEQERDKAGIWTQVLNQVQALCTHSDSTPKRKTATQLLRGNWAISEHPLGLGRADTVLKRLNAGAHGELTFRQGPQRPASWKHHITLPRPNCFTD